MGLGDRHLTQFWVNGPVPMTLRHYYMNEQEEFYDDNPKYPYSPVVINYRDGLGHRSGFGVHLLFT